jgi:alcohol dehydrogenase
LLALTFDGALRVRSDVAVPRPRAGEALIQVRTAGVCDTDIEITRGYKGFHGILGHEFVGEVVECGESSWLGRRVCGEINVACGACEQCEAGLSTHCVRRAVLGIMDWEGAFAEYLVLPVRNLHRVPDELSDDIAVFVEPVAAAYEILQQVSIDQGARVVVLGDGKLGLLCAQVVGQAGADVLLLGKHEEKLQIARDLGLAARRLAGEDVSRADVVVEATGSSTGLQQAIDVVKPRGTIVLKSTTSSRAGADVSGIVVKEITVVGSRCGPFPEAIRALQDGTVRVLPLISERYPLARANQALKRAARPGMLKVLIDTKAE